MKFLLKYIWLFSFAFTLNHTIERDGLVYHFENERITQLYLNKAKVDFGAKGVVDTISLDSTFQLSFNEGVLQKAVVYGCEFTGVDSGVLLRYHEEEYFIPKTAFNNESIQTFQQKIKADLNIKVDIEENSFKAPIVVFKISNISISMLFKDKVNISELTLCNLSKSISDNRYPYMIFLEDRKMKSLIGTSRSEKNIFFLHFKKSKLMSCVGSSTPDESTYIGGTYVANFRKGKLVSTYE